eukprot:COSAG06_NODE_12428_length_1383_cov_52.333333_2_plen_155_part_00
MCANLNGPERRQAAARGKTEVLDRSPPISDSRRLSLGVDSQRAGMAPPVAAGEVHGGRGYELCVHASFCVSGIITTIAMQWEDYHGLGGNSNKPLSRTTALPVLPTFAANVLAVGWMFQQHEGRQLFDKRMWWLVIFALIGEIANQASFEEGWW